MDDHVLLVERTAVLQVPDDLPIRVLHVLPGKVRDLRIEAPIEPHGHGEGVEARGAEGVVVVLAEGRRLVHEARAVVGGHVIAGDHREGAGGALIFKVGKGRLVAAPRKGGARHHLEHF